MTRNEVIDELKLWVSEEPDETAVPMFDLDEGLFNVQEMLSEVENDTNIGQAFVRCYEDVLNGVI